MSAPLPDRLDELLFDHAESTLDAAGVDELNALLLSDASALQRFVRYRMLSAALQLELGDDLASVAQTSEFIARLSEKNLRPTKSRWLIAVAAMALCALVVRWGVLESSTQSLANPIIVDRVADEPTASGIAMVTSLIDVDVSPGSQPLKSGESVLPGIFKIDSGIAQIEFFCGATVILEGPAELKLESGLEARVVSGRLRAMVPPAARGFLLKAHGVDVVDLGTEFALSVGPDGSDVQVFDGEVELRHGNEVSKRLFQGAAVHTNVDASVVENTSSEQLLAARPFLTVEDVQKRSQSSVDSRFARWQAYSDQFRKDSRLIAYYDFEGDLEHRRRLVCALSPKNGELDGAVVGAKAASGRWGIKHALEFKHPGDRVRLQIPGTYGSVSFACWVRIDSLDRDYNSLFLTDAYERGEPHWQILRDGQLFFSIRPRNKGERGGHHVVASAPFWTPSMSGRWLHLATTYNAETGVVRHFLDAKLLHEEVIPENERPLETKFGMASIGNWTDPTRPDAAFAVRNLNGRMDELMIFGDELTPTEIEEMYDVGKP